jgi:hypothetical protein
MWRSILIATVMAPSVLFLSAGSTPAAAVGLAPAAQALQAEAAKPGSVTPVWYAYGHRGGYCWRGGYCGRRVGYGAYYGRGWGAGYYGYGWRPAYHGCRTVCGPYHCRRVCH